MPALPEASCIFGESSLRMKAWPKHFLPEDDHQARLELADCFRRVWATKPAWQKPSVAQLLDAIRACDALGLGATG